MEELLKKELNTEKVVLLGSSSGGCINDAKTYDTDQGKVFVKTNTKSGSRKMFDGEYASLVAIDKVGIVKVPKPYKVIDLPEGGAIFVMENLDLSQGLSKFAPQLGQQLASLHLHNSKTRQAIAKAEGHIGKTDNLTYIDKYGFDVPTCCGFIEQCNTWNSDWISFYSNKLESQVKLAESQYGDREVRELWNTLNPNIHKLFTNVDLEPALLHGDLWSGNAAENSEGPVVYDPASFYGHSEYDLAISCMFGGFGQDFFTAYHKVIPKAEGFKLRLDLYKLFHYLNHWNHFGGGYKNSSVNILKSLVKATR
ncbi:hypothetical protein SNE40_004244 [Patella caerulea]|uniref:protein-ribulosamine 3-kinase n=1 Tax=Patella caerulea TaxID=87958 RepID=A0AAN8Q128_PATCE